jgi:PAS domain-containing protein
LENRNSEAAEENILVLAPLGRDAELAASALRDAGMQAEVCGSLRELIDRLQAPSGVLLMAEEGLEPSLMPRLSAFLEQQPAWSDIPIVLLTGGGSVTQESRTAVHLFGPAANVTLLERPIRVITLTATLQVALRARRRQFEVRDLLRQREQVLASIHDAFVMLDRQWCYTYVNEQAAQLCGKSPTRCSAALCGIFFQDSLARRSRRISAAQ